MSYYFDEEIGGYVIDTDNKIQLFFLLVYLSIKNLPFYILGALEGGLIGMTVIKSDKRSFSNVRKDLISENA